MKIFDEEKIKYILFSVVIILEIMIIGLEVMCFECEEEVAKSNSVVSVIEKEDSEDEVVINKIKVDIKGAIKKAGVYELEEGARISDLIKLAGGLKSNASTKYLNLSKKLEDEMVIKIYTETQIKNMNITYKVQEECKCPSEDITSCAGSNIISNGSSNSSQEVLGKISLNKATKEELMTLSGIGESKAEDIIEYRNTNNGFKSLEELMNVSGIGESVYNKIKDNITL